MSENGSLYEGLEMAKLIFSWPVLATSFILIRLQNLSQKYKYICTVQIAVTGMPVTDILNFPAIFLYLHGRFFQLKS